MKPGQKLCSNCVTLLQNEGYHDNVHGSDDEYHPPSATADKKLYTSVTVLGLSPMYTELGKGT